MVDNIGLDLDALEGKYDPIKFQNQTWQVQDISHDSYVEWLGFVNREIGELINIENPEKINEHKNKMHRLINEAIPDMPEDVAKQLTTRHLVNFVTYLVKEFYRSMGNETSNAKEEVNEAAKKPGNNTVSESTGQDSPESTAGPTP